MCFLYKKTVYSKCGMLHKSLKCVIFQALAGLLVWYGRRSTKITKFGKPRSKRMAVKIGKSGMTGSIEKLLGK